MIPFYAFAFIAVVASLLVIAQRNPIYSVLLLIASFGALSGLYVLLDAPFVAVIQIIVYAGAIMVLFLFVVMLLNAPHEETEYDEQTHPLLRRGPMRFGASLALALGVELCWALARGGESRAFAPGSVDAVAAIGRSLFTTYAFPFEVTSILILVAMLGAVVLARRGPFDSPLILSAPKDERLAQDRPFDSPLILSASKDERLAQDRPFDSPLILSASKDERLAQDRPIDRDGGAPALPGER